MEWSSPPQVALVKAGRGMKVAVPPYSVVFVKVPQAGTGTPAGPSRAQVEKLSSPPELHLLLPSEGYADTPVEGWVRALTPGSDRPWPAALPAARIEVSGPAQVDRPAARLAESAGRFFLQPSGEGLATVTVFLGGQTASAQVRFRSSLPQPQVFWEFDEGTLGKEKGVESAWPLRLDASARANQAVARIELQEVLPDPKHETLLKLSSFPGRDKLKRENIRGLFFDLLVSPDFRSDDADAHLDIVMQSQANYWIQLGSLPLLPGKGTWATHTFPLSDPRQIRAMPEVFNIWLILRASKAVSGTLSLDRVGMLVR